MSSKDVPEPWATRMVERGFTDPRYAQDRPSMSRLAESLDIHTSTVSAAIRGTRRTSPETVVALAEALGDDVAEWLGVEYHGKWQPPPASSLLTDRQRKAIEELINSMTERQEQHRGNTAPIVDEEAATERLRRRAREAHPERPTAPARPGPRRIVDMPDQR